MGVTRIESNRNRHFGLKIESKSIENRNLEIVTSLSKMQQFSDSGIETGNAINTRTVVVGKTSVIGSFVSHCCVL